MMKSAFYGLIPLAFILLFASCSDQKADLQRQVNFNPEWKFIRADIENAQNVNFDDSEWRTLDLPHDYSIDDLPEKVGVKQIGPFSEESAGGASTAHMVGGTAWYRKHFTVDKKDEGKTIQVLFDGIYMNSDVWINGNHLGNHPYGYTAFSFDLTPYLNQPGEDNVLAVQVKNEGKNSRWYSGSGIYRDVTLLKTNPIHIDLWGICITTPTVTPEKATIAVDVKLVNKSAQDKKFTMKMEFLDPDGNKVTDFSDNKELAANSDYNYDQTFEIPEYRVWSLENPQLYQLVVQLWDGNKLMDESKEKFGIRTIEFSPEKGFLLNGKSVLLKGGCMHHDNGPLGSAAFKTARIPQG